MGTFILNPHPQKYPIAAARCVGLHKRLTGTSKNRRERPECKAHGAQKPECTFEYMRILSTAQRSSRVAQQVFRGVLTSQKGIALVMALIMSLAIMAMAGGVLFFVTQATKLSGAGRLYNTASEAADGAVNFAKEMINTTMRGDTQPKVDSLGWEMDEGATPCLTDAILGNATWNTTNLCTKSIVAGRFTANVTLTQLYKIGMGTLEFASSTGTGSMATFYKITVAVTGPDNASADTSVLYRFIN